jgi:manganese efflux pump family protein
MLEVLLLSVALSMDAFAVSIWLWVKSKVFKIFFSIKVALFFAVFQWLMPLFWYFANLWLWTFIESIDHWVAFVLLWFVGAKMLYESFSEWTEDEIKIITNRVLLILAIATSIDAMAAWFTLWLLKLNPFISISIISIITLSFSFFWVFMWTKWGLYLEKIAEKLWWIILILIWLKILIEHTLLK